MRHFSYAFAFAYGNGYCYGNSDCDTNADTDSIGCLPTDAGLLEKSSRCLASAFSDAGQPDI